ncbi:YegS/Rv2252/BmrU family lipid kinase [Clostridium cellulovorans]|uniref:Diacylglycerol kinase catalytic region n=1 Tax=Clostridium cellulovorans (strain ATCC 35296 / DSM 3052 / OCM 3 / 743B) TaxID=573061 RepID=D9SVG7_CLOC7|nr:YegS/Rv2252/BmrU family lipid kinase [Clostridium cellulovorans]ADL51091.1 diacylglycerol kinase catalytic region [Clostridium cellulovorans 743B]
MRRVKLIYNPFSGDNLMAQKLDDVIRIHQEYGYSVVPYRISFESTMDAAFTDINEGYEYIIVAGGDGTVDTAVNCMKNLNIDLPIGIIPVGTANDFAKFLGMSSDVLEACEQIINSDIELVDLGKINDKYFINVASTGMFTDISQKIDGNFKHSMGKVAYYIKGIEEVVNLKKYKIKVSTDEIVFDDYMYSMLVFNGRTAGNLNLAYKAEVQDGMFDVIIIKAKPFTNVVNLCIKIIKGEHLDKSEELVYFKTDKVYIECDEEIVTDIDGERGPDFPVTITCEKGSLKILGLNKSLKEHQNNK